MIDPSRILPATWLNGAKTAMQTAECKCANRRSPQPEQPLQAEAACCVYIEEIEYVDEYVLRAAMGGKELLATWITLASEGKL